MFKALALFLLLVSSGLQAQPSLHTDLPLNYLAQADEQAGNRPLVIFLHGSGSNEQDLFELKGELPRDYNYLSVRAPKSMEQDRYQWFAKKGDGAYDGDTSDLKASGQMLLDFIDKARAKYSTDASKVYLVGFSQGAMMSYEVALRHPEAVGGIAAMGGRVLSALRAELTPNESRRTLAVFIGHGTADPIIPYHDGTEANSFLKTLALEPEFHAYPGVGHSISALEVQDLRAWLERLNP
ncbi:MULTISPECIES: alpha/beta hydrolase [Pseudomonas]|uniref:alpha/beta hydrolase n=1 Tax=Pseudomonas TaxID=286 RepID=UPI00209DEF29|nr:MULTISPECIES: alpha/beta fold hydrolase [Pseudomonas]MCP1455348.1 phospholipase/carboxylesterase [Pseudomonas kilonensis]UVM63405.1 alpha/beta fold hydrolase [Pseudomonas sp. B21-010]WPN65497.1 alpha/beta fold hydrolase [Pseudomonas sp. P9_32]WPN71247.1 alpha/beta fold hydrolase [Pseudomonas sp. P9_35]